MLINTQLGLKKRGDQAIGRSRGGASTKINVATDSKGRLIHFTLTAGQAHESTQAIFLLQGLNFKVVIADKTFDSKAIVDFVESKNGKVVIPSQRSRAVQRQIDQEQYRERNLIERFFCKAKEFV